MYRIRVLSRHPSHRILRKYLPRLPFPSVVRLGSTTELNTNSVEINSVESVSISSDKKRMKQKFDSARVKTAPWTYGNNIEEIISNLNEKEITFPIMAKSRNGSRGIGNTLIEDENQLRNWASGRDIVRYIFEKYFNYALEYRLHITKNGCFYTCRKAFRQNRDRSKDFQRHVDNTVWFLETNENFKKPNSWDDIVQDCVKALEEIGADILSFDVRVQSDKNLKDGSKRDYQNYILIESNSASSMNNDESISVCAQRYLDILPDLITNKRGNK